MKAPISQRVIEILSNKSTADKLVRSVVTKEGDPDNTIMLGGKHYQLQKIANIHKH